MSTHLPQISSQNVMVGYVVSVTLESHNESVGGQSAEIDGVCVLIAAISAVSDRFVPSPPEEQLACQIGLIRTWLLMFTNIVSVDSPSVMPAILSSPVASNGEWRFLADLRFVEKI